jgi:hypothetical protein
MPVKSFPFFSRQIPYLRLPAYPSPDCGSRLGTDPGWLLASGVR